MNQPSTNVDVGAVRQVAEVLARISRAIAFEYQRRAEEAHRELVTQRLS